MGLIGTGLGALAGGITSLLAGPAPEYQRARFNSGVDLDDLDRRAKRGPEELAKMQMEGTQDASVMQGSPDQLANESGALGGANGADVSDALARRSSKRFGGDVAKLHRQSKVDSVDSHYKQVQTNFDVQQKKQAMDRYQDQIAQQAEREQESARYSVLTNLLGGAGAVVGTGVANIKKTGSFLGAKEDRDPAKLWGG